MVAISLVAVALGSGVNVGVRLGVIGGSGVADALREGVGEGDATLGSRVNTLQLVSTIAAAPASVARRFVFVCISCMISVGQTSAGAWD